MIESLFKEKNLKLTNQRKTIIKVINELSNNANVKNIVNKCSNDMDISTIYRILDLLLEKNILEKRINYDDSIYYGVKEEHGHYFTCIKCNKKEKLINCPLEEIENKYEIEMGYKILSHTVLMTGICKKCKELLKNE